MNALKFVRYAAWASIAVLAAVLATAAIVPRLTPQAPQPVTTGKALVGGPFQLETVDGKPFSNKDVEGKPYLVFFGFTNCPDVCPTTLFELTGLLKDLGPAADKIAPLFVTVDPERDTPEMLRVYMNAFDPRITALRGTLEQTQRAAKAFAAYFKKVPLDSGEYTMDHTASVILVKSDGTFQGTLDMHEPRGAQLKKLQMLAATARS
ncbi:redoxin domain-containing protein [Sinorhizobium meliloti]|uniref:SCO family protein n=1 Tax=Rhizobium meliloti TaxID=382 RepID=UPI00299D9190|nr:redoxin domain-containing protein [Sinorhizobium meliloti]